MIVVEIWLWPQGSERHKRLLGRGRIVNTVKKSLATKLQRGDYTVELSKWAPKQDQTWKKGEVLDFRRKTRGAWDLLYLALRDIVGERNP